MTLQPSRTWTRYFFYRKEVVSTTWTVRLALFACIVLLLWLTRGLWTASVGRGLVCDAEPGPVDAILVESFDRDYLSFEQAADLRNRGVANRVLVPALEASDPAEAGAVAVDTVRILATIARLKDPELIPIRAMTPTGLTVANQVRAFLEKERLRSVLVVAPAFRSRRMALVYKTVLARAGMTARCAPVTEVVTPETWTRTWHGILLVVEEYILLELYRFYVIPMSELRARL